MKRKDEMATFDPIRYKEIEREVYSRTAENYTRFGGPIFESMASPLLKGANLKPGQKILDVACGIGIPSLKAAEMVAPSGSVIGVDLAPGMIEMARSRVAEKGLKNIEFREADAESLPFENRSFDTVLCHLGLIHFSDRTRALREMGRVLRPNGDLAISVWSTPDRTRVIGIVSKCVATLWPAAVIPGAPTWFDFGLEGALEKILLDTGFREIKTNRFDFPLEVKDGEDYWRTNLGVSGRLQMLLKNVPQDIAEQIEAQAKAEAEKYRTGGRLSIPCEVVIGWAKK
jgi:ubiquinone/menaquinone biosynthesis C-methylase UbiE